MSFKLNPPLETDIQGAILAMLEMHPAVGAVWRSNGVGRTEVDDGGKKRYVAANRTARGRTQRVPDIMGYMRDGRALYVEVKRSASDVPTFDQINSWDRARAMRRLSRANERALEQWAFLSDAASDGCLAGYADGIEAAQRILAGERLIVRADMVRVEAVG